MNQESKVNSNEMCYSLSGNSENQKAEEKNKGIIEYEFSNNSKSSGDDSKSEKEQEVKRSDDKKKSKRPAWTIEEDEILKAYIKIHGPCKFDILRKHGLLNRDGKSCRQRWSSWLQPGRPNQRKYRGRIELNPEEEKLLTNLQKKLGNSWVRIAEHFPRHTPHELKNLWHGRVKKKKESHGSKLIDESPTHSVGPSSFRDNEKVEERGVSPYYCTLQGFSDSENATRSSWAELQSAAANEQCSEIDGDFDRLCQLLSDNSTAVQIRTAIISSNNISVTDRVEIKPDSMGNSHTMMSETFNLGNDTWNNMHQAPDVLLEQLCSRTTSIWPNEDFTMIGHNSNDMSINANILGAVEPRCENFEGLDEVLIRFCRRIS